MPGVLNRRMMALLFLSSYSPLFILLALRTFHKSAPMFILSCTALGIAIVGIALFAIAARLRSAETHRVLSAEARDGDLAGFAATYLLPFLGIFGAGWRDVLALALFIVLIGVIYVQSRMIFVNPVLIVFGYHIYFVQTTTAPSGSEPKLVPSRWLVCRRDTVAEGDMIDVRQVTGETLFSFGAG
jgi:Ni/Fe-hydrogenase subunit HybB-like protein